MDKKRKNAVCDQLRGIRSAKELSQAALASLCQRHGWNITREIIARIEGRVRCVCDYELILLAEILEVPVTKLLPSPEAWRESAHLFVAPSTR